MLKKDVARVLALYDEVSEGEFGKLFDNAAFGYSTITVERPQRDAQGEIVRDRKGRPVADAELRDTECVPDSRKGG